MWFSDVFLPRGLQHRRRLRAERRAADAEILSSDWVSPLLAWRVNELVARKNRRQLARSLRDAVKTADGRYLPNASPINRRAVRVESKRLLALAGRLEDEHAVAPRGVLLVDRLLTDGFGPLYSRDHADALPSHLDVTLKALEP
jgi:hypothetical protein